VPGELPLPPLPELKASHIMAAARHHHEQGKILLNQTEKNFTIKGINDAASHFAKIINQYESYISKAPANKQKISSRHLELVKSAYTYRAYTFLFLNDLATARKDCESAIKMNGITASTYSVLASTYHMQNNFDLAIENYLKSIKLAPKNVRLHYKLALAYAKKGEYGKAIENYNVVLKHKKDVNSEPILGGNLTLINSELVKLLNLSFANLSGEIVDAFNHLKEGQLNVLFVEEIFDLIKKLPRENTISLLKDCLNDMTPLGKRFKGSSVICKEIQDHLNKLAEPEIKQSEVVTPPIVVAQPIPVVPQASKPIAANKEQDKNINEPTKVQQKQSENVAPAIDVPPPIAIVKPREGIMLEVEQYLDSIRGHIESPGHQWKISLFGATNELSGHIKEIKKMLGTKNYQTEVSDDDLQKIFHQVLAVFDRTQTNPFSILKGKIVRTDGVNAFDYANFQTGHSIRARLKLHKEEAAKNKMVEAKQMPVQKALEQTPPVQVPSVQTPPVKVVPKQTPSVQTPPVQEIPIKVPPSVADRNVSTAAAPALLQKPAVAQPAVAQREKNKKNLLERMFDGIKVPTHLSTLFFPSIPSKKAEVKEQVAVVTEGALPIDLTSVYTPTKIK
jgi:tetratricopeptide (TPR) repeat protein